MDCESLQNLLASLAQQSAPRPSPPPIPALPALHRGDVIEIQGPAASGKTHLLYHILLSVLAAGPQIAVVVYDTDAAFDVQRLRHLLFSRMSAAAPDKDDSVRRSLARLHIFRPTSLTQLAASIANLPAYHSSQIPNQEIALLAVDSISAFYWADRFDAEQSRAIGIGPESPTTPPPLHNVLTAIQAVRRSHSPLVVLTNWALSPPSHTEPLYRQHLHPFPLIDDGIADLGAKASINTDHSSSSPLRLAHHIALSFPLPEQLPPPPDASHETRSENRQVHCLTRSSRARNASPFAFYITPDDVLVQPQEQIIDALWLK